MLVLQRRRGESICVPTPSGMIKFTVCDVKGDKVRVGVEAPKEIPVHREEILERIMQKHEEKMKLANNKEDK